jgi:aminodeoxyfutalosine deaminase
MSFRKFKADYLFDGFKMRPGNPVLICQNDGRIEDIVEENQAGSGLEVLQGMISPGLVNCHCHLELSHLKGLIAEKQGLVDFVLSVVLQRNLPEEVRTEAIFQAESQMIDSGIVAVGDICNGSDTLPAKSARRLDYYNFIELLGWVPQQAVSRFESAKKLADLFQEKGQEKLSLSPHAPYSVSEELWNLISPGFQGKTITIHNQESKAENEFFLGKRGDLTRMYERMKIDSGFFNPPGTTSLSYFLPKLKGAARLLLVHNTYMEEPDLIGARNFQDQLFFCLCPNANIYIEDHLPDIPMFVKNKARLALGTDSLASNHQLNILEEIKTIKNNFPSIPTADMLVWATSNGAAALSLDETLGDFSKGKKPGVVHIGPLSQGEINTLSTSRRIL